jgi:cytochrome c oxidase subunit 2
VNKPVKLDLQTSDVNHSFFVPAFRIKEDITAGRQNYLVLHPTKTGIFDILCSEYCGMSHSNMLAKLVVKDEINFNAWLNSKIESQDTTIKSMSNSEKK